MPIIDILFNKIILTAILIYTPISIAIEIISSKLVLYFQDTAANEWMLERIFIPLARAIGLMIFILLCYPILFGISQAPPLISLITTGSHRIHLLMNILFVLPLLFSLIPFFGKIPALLLPIQGIAGSTLIFSWMQAAMPHPREIHYVPSFSILLTILLMAVVTHTIAKWLSEIVANHINDRFQIVDSEKITYRILIVTTQLPVVLVYTRGLGAQLLNPAV